MKNKKKLILWGATGQAVALEEFLKVEYEIDALFDNNKKIESPFQKIKLYHGKSGFMKWLSNKKKNSNFIVAIGGGNGKDRVSISKFLIKKKLKLISAINKKTNIASNVKMGKGLQILMNATIGAKCKIGNYDPEECCESTEYGPSCIASCYDGENCYNFSGKMPLNKIYKRDRAKKLLQKLVRQKAGAYDKIYNPQTKRWVLSSGKLGKNILQKYLNRV